METRINPNQVSHIAICDGHKGFPFSNKIVEFKYKPKKKFLFFKTDDEGWYAEDGYNTFKKLPPFCYSLLDELYTYPLVSVFCGEKRIKIKSFETLEQAKEWVTQNFPNCNVIVE